MPIGTEDQGQSERIITAAFEIISTRGYANVSMRDIADKAGVVLSQLNYYFKNKEGLFKEVVRIMIGKYLQEIESSLVAEESPKERIKSLINYFRKMLKYNPELFRLLYDFTGLALWSPVFGDLLSELFKDLSDMIEKYIMKNLKMSELKGYSTKSLSRLILGAMFGTGIQVLLDDDDDLLESLNAMQVLFE
ncbi:MULTISPECIES: TetR/AcrR family transcriptional regulator [Bacillota]|uniref:AcrR family transcriptional regulator n=1 Tax=Youngiibacter fragilis 232.1 TaxID=994573 RepID=V7IBQ4_9CLOT|nr:MULTISPECIES: TetR/AcrR family transcriptional regulator [Bacillota]EKZ4777409.1 TetR/AcrR family transcriptional regulator [Listeria monocytogenes]ELB3406691.1 TetR/AcrR family transcriptional regulator [Listeria monocytogenes]ETA82307.1 AcrR family transcriptional regulator [Youngiibacter fragilis 232.1]MDA5722621.1 TetR/AcrR family transcriptional regulator [Listeria monocytogenes]MDA6035499.1 TetR/AcrR family transcriptional regulator [Listeria monocytogenes]